MKTTDYWTDDKDGYLERNQYLDYKGLVNFFTGGVELPYIAWQHQHGINKISSICEYGCNVGLNLRVMEGMFPEADIHGFDVNFDAVEIANELEDVTAEYGNLLDPDNVVYDLVLTKGLLIHIAPEHIETAYESLYNMTGKYLLICEYYNPYQVEVEYRGKNGLLWKRDFCSEMLDKYEDLTLIDYGFRYHRDANPQDDVTWFLIQKETK